MRGRAGGTALGGGMSCRRTRGGVGSGYNSLSKVVTSHNTYWFR